MVLHNEAPCVQHSTGCLFKWEKRNNNADDNLSFGSCSFYQAIVHVKIFELYHFSLLLSLVLFVIVGGEVLIHLNIFHVNFLQPMAFKPRPVRAVFRGSSCPTQWKLPMASTWTWTSSSMLMILKKAIPSKGSTFSEGSRAHPNSALCPEISVFLGMGLGLQPRKAHGLGRPPWGPSLNHG